MCRVASIGTVQSQRTVAIKSRVDGVIAQIHFREGDEVNAGDLLVALDRRPFENSLRIARALREGEGEWARVALKRATASGLGASCFVKPCDRRCVVVFTLISP